MHAYTPSSMFLLHFCLHEIYLLKTYAQVKARLADTLYVVIAWLKYYKHIPESKKGIRSKSALFL